jgi:hypothetical protein
LRPPSHWPQWLLQTRRAFGVGAPGFGVGIGVGPAYAYEPYYGYWGSPYWRVGYGYEPSFAYQSYAYEPEYEYDSYLTCQTMPTLFIRMDPGFGPMLTSQQTATGMLRGLDIRATTLTLREFVRPVVIPTQTLGAS